MPYESLATALVGMLLLAAGILVAASSFRGVSDDFLGNTRPWRERAARSVESGFGISLAGIGAIVAANSLLWGGAWTFKGVVALAGLGLVLTTVTTLGSLWQYFIIGRFRNRLFEFFRHKNKD